MRFSDLDFDAAEVEAYGVAVDYQGRDSSWHKHDRFHQITMSVTGTLRFDDETYHWLLPPDRAAVVPARVGHRVRASKAGSLNLVYLSRLAFEIPIREVCVLDVPPLAREMILYAHRWGPHELAAASDLAKSFFRTLSGLLPDWLARPLLLRLARPSSPEIERAVSYMLEHLEDPRFEEAARRAGLSTRSLTRRFRQETGINWRNYLQVARVLRAVELLGNQGTRVTEVALAVGFSSPASFSQAFRNLLGVSPRTYRNQRSGL
jgi:AraC-like DNA-binding protein